MNAAEAEQIGAMIVRWEEKHIPPIKPVCFERVKRWRVAYLQGEELQNLCTKRACFMDDSSGFFLWPDIHPTAVIPSHYSEEERLAKLREKVIQWLSWCANLGLDPQKKNKDVWSLENP